jgi:hypothetical protein
MSGMSSSTKEEISLAQSIIPPVFAPLLVEDSRPSNDSYTGDKFEINVNKIQIATF